MSEKTLAEMDAVIDALDARISALEADVTTLQSQITDESMARQGADSELSNRIDKPWYKRLFEGFLK